jgi:hypothetical protein
MISTAEINLGEHFGSIQLIKQVFNLWKGVLVLDGYLVEFTVIHTVVWYHLACPQTEQVIPMVRRWDG